MRIKDCFLDSREGVNPHQYCNIEHWANASLYHVKGKYKFGCHNLLAKAVSDKIDEEGICK